MALVNRQVRSLSTLLSNVSLSLKPIPRNHAVLTLNSAAGLYDNVPRNFHNCTFRPADATDHCLKSKTELLSIKNKCIDLDPVVKRLFDGLQEGKRASLAESITLVESSNIRKKRQAKQLLSCILQSVKEKKCKKQDSYRIGLSGPPGAGKSTFIESFGKLLTSKGFKVAVLAVDPSSATTGGSILGDKTRMPELSKDKKAFIRPSPSRGHLGGVTRSTNEAIVLCEASGYDVIIVETVGVGQSEYAVSDMVDIFSLLIPPGSGDEMQGIKRGIMELSDVIVVNKSDGDLVQASMRVQYEYISALKFMQPRNKNWKPVVKRVSSVENKGIEELWELMLKFKEIMQKKGDFKKKREFQRKAWMWNHLKDGLMSTFLDVPSVKNKIKECELRVMKETLSPGDASDMILIYIKENIAISANKSLVEF